MAFLLASFESWVHVKPKKTHGLNASDGRAWANRPNPYNSCLPAPMEPFLFWGSYRNRKRNSFLVFLSVSKLSRVWSQLLSASLKKYVGMDGHISAVVGCLLYFNIVFENKCGCTISKKITKGCWGELGQKRGLWMPRIGAENFTIPGHRDSMSL